MERQILATPRCLFSRYERASRTGHPILSMGAQDAVVKTLASLEAIGRTRNFVLLVKEFIF